ncbi:MAG: PIN domain-containing protein [Spirochaetia bacterium]|nr:PIN domain-containing protein [Spirochaetia bacterium]
MKRVYLDVCCLNRPFDDQEQERIHLESEAVRYILKHIRLGDVIWIGSSVLDLEINRTTDIEKRDSVIAFMAELSEKIFATEKEIERARVLESLGFKAMDALHLVCAEKAKVDAFLTVDDKLMKKSKANVDKLRVRVENPVTWLQEVIE